MEYIQCSNCKKKYLVNDQVRAAVGRDTNCGVCKQAFTIVIYGKADAPKPKVIDTPLAQGWDPAQTMPDATEPEREQAAAPAEATTSDTEEAELAALHAARNKKKQHMYIAVALVCCLLLGGLTLWWLDDEAAPLLTKPSAPIAKQHVGSIKAVAQAEDSVSCKKAAAAQWVIDHTVMHGDYSAAEYVRLLKRSQEQSAVVRNACSSASVIQDILESATKQLMPAWFEPELHALLGDSYAKPQSVIAPAL